MRSILLFAAILLAAPATAQTVFRATPLDQRQNERLDAAESRLDRIESAVDRLVVAIESKPDEKLVTTEKPKPKPPTPASTPSVASGRYSAVELAAIARQAFPSGWTGPRYADVSPRSAVYSHLKSGVHGFSSAQVDSLSLSDALAIHDLNHGRKVMPTKGGYQAPAKTLASVQRTVTQSAGSGCANGQCARPSASYSRSSGRLFPRLFGR